jgi:hypothetical protein
MSSFRATGVGKNRSPAAQCINSSHSPINFFHHEHREKKLNKITLLVDYVLIFRHIALLKISPTYIWFSFLLGTIQTHTFLLLLLLLMDLDW